MSRVLTLSATYGAGGSVIAPKLAARLHLPFYDRLTHGPDTRSTEKIEERLTDEERSQTPPGRLAVSLSHLSGALGIPVPGAGDLDPNNELRQKVAESVWRVAETGGGLILGRGAAAVLATYPSAFHHATRRPRRATHRAGRGHRGRLRRRRRSAPARHGQVVGPVRATAVRPRSRGRQALQPRHRLDRHGARRRHRDSRLRRDRVLGARHRMPMTPEQIHQRRWMTLAVLCLLAGGHQRRQHDPQRGAAIDRPRPRRRGFAAAVDHRLATRSCLPACSSPPARSATASGARRRSP